MRGSRRRRPCTTRGKRRSEHRSTRGSDLSAQALLLMMVRPAQTSCQSSAMIVRLTLIVWHARVAQHYLAPLPVLPGVEPEGAQRGAPLRDLPRIEESIGKVLGAIDRRGEDLEEQRLLAADGLRQANRVARWPGPVRPLLPTLTDCTCGLSIVWYAGWSVDQSSSSNVLAPSRRVPVSTNNRQPVRSRFNVDAASAWGTWGCNHLMTHRSLATGCRSPRRAAQGRPLRGRTPHCPEHSPPATGRWASPRHQTSPRSRRPRSSSLRHSALAVSECNPVASGCLHSDTVVATTVSKKAMQQQANLSRDEAQTAAQGRVRTVGVAVAAFDRGGEARPTVALSHN